MNRDLELECPCWWKNFNKNKIKLVNRISNLENQICKNCKNAIIDDEIYYCTKLSYGYIDPDDLTYNYALLEVESDFGCKKFELE